MPIIKSIILYYTLDINVILGIGNAMFIVREFPLLSRSLIPSHRGYALSFEDCKVMYQRSFCLDLDWRACRLSGSFSGNRTLRTHLLDSTQEKMVCQRKYHTSDNYDKFQFQELVVVCVFSMARRLSTWWPYTQPQRQRDLHRQPRKVNQRSTNSSLLTLMIVARSWHKRSTASASKPTHSCSS